MVLLQMAGMTAVQSVSLGPAPWFRIGGNHIRQGPNGTLAGEMRNHHWFVGDRAFSRIDCEGPVVMQFENMLGGPSQDFGPFKQLHVADGTIYADNKLFAKLIEETQLWHCFATENFWPVLLIKSG